MLVHVLWIGLHAGWCDPGRCLSLQILCIPGKSTTYFFMAGLQFSLVMP